MLIPTKENTKTITDLRERALDLLKQVQKSGPTYIFHHSQPKAVMISIEEYANLLDTLEDYLDSLKAQDLEANPESGGKTIAELAKKHSLKKKFL